jgi:hypothetical protein
VQQADGARLRIVGTEGIGADQFGELLVERSGRISCSTTGTPLRASCQAASDPARPPPTTWTGRRECMPFKLGAWRLRYNARGQAENRRTALRGASWLQTNPLL